MNDADPSIIRSCSPTQRESHLRTLLSDPTSPHLVAGCISEFVALSSDALLSCSQQPQFDTCSLGAELANRILSSPSASHGDLVSAAAALAAPVSACSSAAYTRAAEFCRKAPTSAASFRLLLKVLSLQKSLLSAGAKAAALEFDSPLSWLSGTKPFRDSLFELLDTSFLRVNEAFDLLDKDKIGAERCGELVSALSEVTGTISVLFGAVLSAMSALPWSAVTRASAAEACGDMAAMCKALFRICVTLSKLEMLKDLNLAWKNLKECLRNGREFLRTLFPVGEVVVFLFGKVTELLRIATSSNGKADEWARAFRIAQFYLHNVITICKLYASSLSSSDLRKFVAFYCDTRMCVPPCLDASTVSPDIADKLRSIASQLDSLLACVFESLYPSSESVGFLKLLVGSGSTSVVMLMGLCSCIRASQSFSGPDIAEYVLLSCVPLVFELLSSCYNQITEDDSALEAVVTSLSASLEAAVSSGSISGVQYVIDALLLRNTVHENPVVSLVATRLWVHIVSRGDMEFRSRAVNMVLEMLTEMNSADKQFLPVQDCGQLLRLLAGFCSFASRDIKRNIFNRLVCPPQSTGGHWEPCATAVMFFTSLPLPLLVDESAPPHHTFNWFLANVTASLKHQPASAAPALCARGIVGHTSLHETVLQKETLVDVANIAATALCSGKCRSVPVVAALLGVVSFTMPYAKQSLFKPLLMMCARIAVSSPDLSYAIGEFCSDCCSFLPLEVLPDVGSVFRALFQSPGSTASLCHTLKCFHRFAGSCQIESVVTDAVPPEREDDLGLFLGLKQPPTPGPSPTPMLTPAAPQSQQQVPHEEMNVVVTALAEFLSGMPREMAIPNDLATKLSSLSDLIASALKRSGYRC